MTVPLRRELTFTSAAALVVSNMIGTGIFTTTGFLAGDLGRPSLLFAVWLAGAAVAMAGCLSYSELGINFPRSGGEYVYLREAWGPAWGFLSGWISFFAGFSAPIAAGALAFVEYVGHFVPALAVSGGGPAGGASSAWPGIGYGHALAVGVVVAFAVINILGVRLAARIQNALTALKLAVLGTFLVMAFALGEGDFANYGLAAARTTSTSGAAQFAVSLIFVMFAYSGWNAATYVAEEMRTPERTLPRALAAGTALVALLYLALNAAFVYALPLEQMKGVVAIGARAAARLFGPAGGNVFSAVMAMGILSCVSAMVLVGPRVYYAMAQDGCFFRGAAQVHPRWQTPVRAIVFQTVAAAALILTGTFQALIYYIGFALILSAAMATAGIFRLRRRPGWKRLKVVSWCYPLVPAAFVGTSAWMLVYTLALRPRESLLGLATVAAGAVIYYLKFRPATRTPTTAEEERTAAKTD